jgi:uncharacterized protein YaaR (DUF327 family)
LLFRHTVNFRAENHSERLTSISSKYKSIGNLNKEEPQLESPKTDKNKLQEFEKKYLKPLFTKQEEADLNLTYSLHEEAKKEDTSRRI